MIAARRHDDQTVDPPREECLRELALARAILVRATHKRQHAASPGNGLDAAQHGRVERVRDVLEDDPDARRVTVRAAQVGGRQVAPVAKQDDRRADLVGELGAHAVLAVHDS